MPKGFVGIDFGTSNSAVVLYEKHYRRFTNIGDDSNNPIPSVVAIDRLNQEVQCGRQVRQHILELRDRESHIVIDSIKTRLASQETWLVGQTTWNVESAAAELFKFLSRSVDEVSGSPIVEAVVAIPVGLGLERRKAIRKAAGIAGIKIMDFVSEPTAAFMTNAQDLGHCKYVAVFDWGGGTLDISVLEVSGSCITERYTDGWDKAGDVIDETFAVWIHSQLAEKYGFRMAFDNVAPNERQNLINQAEDCKCRLQREGIDRQKLSLGRYAGVSPVEVVIEKEDFEALMGPIVAEAVDRLLHAVDAARISRKEIGKLVVVGGSSKLLRLQQELHSRWPFANILTPPDADWHIARGAALLAANPGCYRSAESVGVMLSDDSYHPIFPSGTSVRDAHFNIPFGLVEDSRTATFVFASSNLHNGQPQRIGEMHVKTLGFRDELIELESRITEDLVFLASGRSQLTNEESLPASYDRLRWVYEIPSDER